MVVRVFLLDDHEIVREGLRQLLETTGEFRVVGDAANCADAIARIPATRPDLIVIDAQLPDGNGIDVCRQVRAKLSGVRCLVLTGFADDELVRFARECGVRGFVVKQLHRERIVDAARRVHAGDTVFDPCLAVDVASSAGPAPGGGASDEARRLDALTDVERRVLALVADGLTNRQIAQELKFAEKTAKNHVSSILSKLGVRRRTEAAVFLARAR